MKKQLGSKAAREALAKATHGLAYMSESDEPFEIAQPQGVSGAFGEADARRLAQGLADRPVREEPLDQFFGELAKDEDWHGKAEREEVRRYRKLWQLFQEQLADAKVFRVGAVQVDIIIVGRAADGNWIGVKTRAIET